MLISTNNLSNIHLTDSIKRFYRILKIWGHRLTHTSTSYNRRYDKLVFFKKNWLYTMGNIIISCSPSFSYKDNTSLMCTFMRVDFKSYLVVVVLKQRKYFLFLLCTISSTLDKQCKFGIFNLDAAFLPQQVFDHSWDM